MKLLRYATTSQAELAEQLPRNGGIGDLRKFSKRHLLIIGFVQATNADSHCYKDVNGGIL